MKYDIAAKVVVDISKNAILRDFLGIKPKSIKFIRKLPEETVSIRRSDFPLHVTLNDESEIIVIIEIQTRFDNDFVLRLIDYTVRYKLKYHQKVIPLVLLLIPSSLATGIYEDDVLTFKYKFVSFAELQAEDFLDEISLYPFLPLMNDGERLLEKAETIIYENKKLKTRQKADLLSAMAIFAGLKNKELGIWLAERRRDIMIESPVYEFIKKEGFKEGLEKGLEQGLEKGLEQGLEQGLEKGRKEGLYEAILLVLEVKFGVDGIALTEKIRKIDSMQKLEMIKEAVKIAKDVKEIEKLL